MSLCAISSRMPLDESRSPKSQSQKYPRCPQAHTANVTSYFSSMHVLFYRVVSCSIFLVCELLYIYFKNLFHISNVFQHPASKCQEVHETRVLLSMRLAWKDHSQSLQKRLLLALRVAASVVSNIPTISKAKTTQQSCRFEENGPKSMSTVIQAIKKTAVTLDQIFNFDKTLIR